MVALMHRVTEHVTPNQFSMAAFLIVFRKGSYFGFSNMQDDTDEFSLGGGAGELEVLRCARHDRSWEAIGARNKGWNRISRRYKNGIVKVS